MFTFARIMIAAFLCIVDLIVSIATGLFTKWYFGLLVFFLLVVAINILLWTMTKDQEKRERKLADDALGSA